MSDRKSEMADVLRELHDLVIRWKDAVRKKPKRIPRSLLGYGFALTDGTCHFGEPCFLVVTQAGESMVLTHELLRALERDPLVLCAEVVCSLESRDVIEDEYQPVRTLELLQAVGFSRQAPKDYSTITTRVSPEDLEFSRWTIFTRQRPVGWPR